MWVRRGQYSRVSKIWSFQEDIRALCLDVRQRYYSLQRTNLGCRAALPPGVNRGWEGVLAFLKDDIVPSFVVVVVAVEA